MFALPSGSEFHDGAIRVVLDTDEITVLCLEGEFDVTNASTLGDHLERALACRNDLILDLSQATFIDSSVIHVLVNGARAADLGNQTMVLQLATGQHAERLLDICQIGRAIPRAYDRDEAVGIIQQTRDLSAAGNRQSSSANSEVAIRSRGIPSPV